MAEYKNTELSDEMMKGAAGGSDDERPRYEDGTVIGPFPTSNNDAYEIAADYGPTIIAHYNAIGLVEQGRRVRCELVGLGKWNIVEFLD